MARPEELTIDGAAPLVIGATGMEAILQNIRIIVLTMAYSVPLDRAFAHAGGFIDSPSPAVTARLVAALVDAIEAREPRVVVDGIDLLENSDAAGLMEGRLVPRIRFHLKDGVRL